MTKSPSILTKTLLILAVAGSMAAFTVQPAAAQGASSLSCKGCVKSRQLKNGGIKEKDIKDGAITGSKVASDSITASDLQNEPGLDYLHDPGQPEEISVSNTWATMRQIDVTHPGSGYVYCIGTGHMEYDAQNNGWLELGWHTEAGSSTPPSYNLARVIPAANQDHRIPISAMYTFEVSDAGTTTFYLKGRTNTGNANAFDFAFHGLVCIYFATRY